MAAGFLLAGCGERETYPSRPIVLICPWSAGGGTDLVARQVAALLEEELAVPVNVVNATGGAGVTGHTRGALAPADGYTLTLITVELNMLHWRGLTNIDHQDFEPVAMLNRDDAAVFVRADSPWKTLADLERAIRAQPGSLKASGTAQGGIWHVALAGWLDSIGLATDTVTWISINGASPSLQELLSGGVELVCCALPEARTLLEAGEVRCLGVMADDRAAAFPEVPTFREQGYPWSAGGWRGLAVPRNVPRDRYEILVKAASRVAAGEGLRRFMDSNGFNTSIEGPREFAASLAASDAHYGEVLTSDAFRPVRTSRYGPYVFPYALAGGMAAVVLGLLASGGLRRSEDAEPITRGGLARIAAAVVAIVGFVALLDEVGYVISGFALLLVLLLALRVRWPVALVVSLVVVPLSYQVFAVGLRVPLPWGWLGW
jgi:tripartite-type tricarboxylate transporter receptor subunit TctC